VHIRRLLTSLVGTRYFDHSLGAGRDVLLGDKDVLGVASVMVDTALGVGTGPGPGCRLIVVQLARVLSTSWMGD